MIKSIHNVALLDGEYKGVWHKNSVELVYEENQSAVSYTFKVDTYSAIKVDVDVSVKWRIAFIEHPQPVNNEN